MHFHPVAASALGFVQGLIGLAIEPVARQRHLRIGDGHARRTLAGEIYPALAANKELLDTCVGFLDAGSSMEATARALFVHPNTVRYRLKRIQDVTGYNPADAREAYVLRMAITLGRLQD